MTAQKNPLNPRVYLTRTGEKIILKILYADGAELIAECAKWPEFKPANGGEGVESV